MEEDEDEDVDSEGSGSDGNLSSYIITGEMNINYDRNHFSSSSSNSSVVSTHSLSGTPLSDSSFDASVNTDPEDIGA
ncbi:Hypothetical protein CINCED_3A015032 [Cinara cedri]|uniref:Uncharacterized protein n=1 Tax=Cinara cedri TaxID=506608 RepID=A0A5E4N5E6_9HEMI|nr:Hypothetical protein CINCED_3A015032 [Cinara cedri]